jgi:hypothetical protein
MSPRAAWRLEQLGFTHVYDYTAGKVDRIASGWPTEGPGPAQPRVLSAMDSNVPTCHLAEPVGAVRRRFGDGPTSCVVFTSAASLPADSNTSTVLTDRTDARSAR